MAFIWENIMQWLNFSAFTELHTGNYFSLLSSCIAPTNLLAKVVTVKKFLCDVNERKRSKKNESAKKWVYKWNMHKISFYVANVIFRCSHIAGVCRFFFPSTYGNHFARRFMSIHILCYFRPYTQCNKFPGETLNINLLLCWLRLFCHSILYLAHEQQQQTRMLAVHEWQRNHWSFPIESKKKNR